MGFLHRSAAANEGRSRKAARGMNSVSEHMQIVPAIPVSPLVLSDRLITLAQDADRAGYIDAARRLVHLAYSVFDEAPGHA